MIRVQWKEQTLTVPQGSTLQDVARELRLPDEFVVARMNNEVFGLQTELSQDCTVEFLDTTSVEGMRAYRAGLVFLFVKAAYEVLPGATIFIKHSIANGIYGEIAWAHPVIEKDIQAVYGRMLELVKEDLPFELLHLSVTELREKYRAQGLQDKLRLLEHYADGDILPVYRCGDYYDWLTAVLVPSTGVLKHFKLRYYLPGFILEYPRRANPKVVPPYVEQGKLFNVFFQAEQWQNNLKIPDVAALNRTIDEGKFPDLVKVCEAHHEKQIAQIADLIKQERERLRIILIAGPSSSGKTTFAQRLLVQLRVNGLWPITIGLDDYFVDRDKTPIGEDGKADFEALQAIDLELFNTQLTKLIQGEEVELPTFDFKEGRRKWTGRVLRITEDQPIIIEGIHGLNDQLTAAIPQGRKFKIYISALTNLNIDNHTRVSTADARMLRRIVRDHHFRGHSAKSTIQMWPSVRRGEELHIFPFQESADVMFNSSLVYELSVLKGAVEPLLQEITPDDEEYGEARRLLTFLRHFRAVPPSKVIPCNSILREFIGGSCMH
ncbi:MAG: nucleoside kinase [Firmicutes bacterium]|nr:nucleoside kinase [Bacillota bacterium]